MWEGGRGGGGVIACNAMVEGGKKGVNVRKRGIRGKKEEKAGEMSGT